MKKGQYAEAISLFSAAAAGSPALCGLDLVKDAYSSITIASDKIGKSDEAEKWFRRYAARYNASSYDWDAEAIVEIRSMITDLRLKRMRKPPTAAITTITITATPLASVTFKLLPRKTACSSTVENALRLR
jgi:hypothetical protein